MKNVATIIKNPKLSFSIILQLICYSVYIERAISTTIDSNEWPLRYHHSPWLHQEFLVREQSDPAIPFNDSNVLDNNNPNFYETNDDDEYCNRFIPSIHCERKMKAKNLSLHMDTSLTMNEWLDISRLETITKEENRKTMTFQRCYYLNESLIDEMCINDHRSIRKELLENLHLRSCRRFLVERSLSKHLYSLVINSTDCSRILKELLLLDNLVDDLACEYESILHRYDCQAKWSVVWTCRDCKLAYKDWLCSVIIPYHLNGNLIKPCPSVCEQVEQKCPHLHPYGKGQYAGEPVFLCIDPNIPFNKKITPDIPFGDEGQCYNLCDLEPCLNEENEAPVLNCPIVKSNTEQESIENEFNDSETQSFDYGIEQSSFDESFPTMEIMNNEIQRTTEFSLSSTTGDELDLSDSFFDDTHKEQQSTTNPPQWISNEDDYVLTSIREMNNKQTQSLQFVESDPVFQQSEMDTTDNHPLSSTSKKNESPSDQISTNMVSNINTESTSSTIDPQTYQDIYREAMASTTIDPFDSISNEQTLLNDELNKDSMLLIMKDREWTTLTTMAPPLASSTMKSAEQSSTTGTEQSPTINVQKNYGKAIFYKYLTSGENENTPGNRFRHFNSRNKEKQNLVNIIGQPKNQQSQEKNNNNNGMKTIIKKEFISNQNKRDHYWSGRVITSDGPKQQKQDFSLYSISNERSFNIKLLLLIFLIIMLLF